MGVCNNGSRSEKRKIITNNKQSEGGSIQNINNDVGNNGLDGNMNNNNSISNNNNININVSGNEEEKNKITILKTNEYTNSNINYYLVCPDCSVRSPHVEKLYYNEESKQFFVRYTCVCNKNTMHSKEIPLMNLLSNKEPLNFCNIHTDKKLINFCKTCRRAICSECKEQYHYGHNIEEHNEPMTKEEADKMLILLKEKEQKFNDDINLNKQKMENGIDNIIQQLNEKKINYKEQIKNYKDNNLKTFDFLKNLYSRYMNNFSNNGQNNGNNNNSFNNQDNNIIYNDIMLTNYISNFAIVNSNIPKLNSNIDEIVNQYNDEEKELELKYDYGFNLNTNTYYEDKNNNNNAKQSNILKKSPFAVNKIQEKRFNCIKTLDGHTEKIVSLIELSSGKLASGSYDSTIRIWDIYNNREEKLIKEMGKVLCLLEFEEDKLLSGTSDNCINLWDLNSDEDNCQFSFKGHTLWVNSLVKLNNNYFASASNDSKIRIWDYYNKNCFNILKGHTDCILYLILLKQNNNYLCSGSVDLTIRIWDWENSNCLHVLRGHKNWVKCICELSNGIILSGSDDYTIKLWKDYYNINTLEGHSNSIRALCQINDDYFASGSFDSTIKIWDINSWKCIMTLYGHESNIICLISLNYKNDDINNSKINYLASCSNDKTIKIWEGYS